MTALMTNDKPIEERVQMYLEQLAPHVRDREGAQLLAELLAAYGRALRAAED